MEAFNGHVGKLVGVEASNSAFIAVCLDSSGRISGSEKAAFDRSSDSLPQIFAFIGHLKESFGSFDKIGVAVPGLVEKGSQRVAYSATIPEHARVDLASEIQAATGIRAT